MFSDVIVIVIVVVNGSQDWARAAAGIWKYQVLFDNIEDYSALGPKKSKFANLGLLGHEIWLKLEHWISRPKKETFKFLAILRFEQLV